MTITEFLEARLAEDEQAARDRPNSAQIHYSGCYYYNYSLDAGWECDCDEDGAGTRRLLAECAAKRAVIAIHASPRAFIDQCRNEPDWCDCSEYSHGFKEGWHDAGDSALKHLAAVYASHEDYLPEWAL